MKLGEFKKWQDEWKLEDSWWMSQDGAVTGPHKLPEIAALTESSPNSSYFLMHTCFSGSESPSWLEYTRDTEVPETDRQSMKRTTMRLAVRRDLTTSRMIQLRPKAPPTHHG